MLKPFHHCFALARLGTEGRKCQCCSDCSRVDAETRSLDGGGGHRSASQTRLQELEEDIKPCAARLPGIIGMQPTTAGAQPRGESDESEIRFKSARTKAAMIEAAGKRTTATHMLSRAHRKGNGSAPNPIHKRRSRQLNRTAKPAAATPPKKA